MPLEGHLKWGMKYTYVKVQNGHIDVVEEFGIIFDGIAT
jgi:hypothetical protein